MTRQEHVSCVHKQHIAPAIWEVHLAKPAGFQFRAGQFVLFHVPLVQDPGDRQARAYSIASSPGEPTLRFVIKQVPGGRAGEWMEHVLREGSIVDVSGPFGAFTLDRFPGHDPVLFIATGTGVAPMRSMILHALQEERTQRPLHLVAGFRTASDQFWNEEWQALEQAFPQFSAGASYMSGEADWHRDRGSLQERLPSLLAMYPTAHVALCGDPSTVQALRAACMEYGVPKERLHAEQYV